MKLFFLITVTGHLAERRMDEWPSKHYVLICVIFLSAIRITLHICIHPHTHSHSPGSHCGYCKENLDCFGTAVEHDACNAKVVGLIQGMLELKRCTVQIQYKWLWIKASRLHLCIWKCNVIYCFSIPVEQGHGFDFKRMHEVKDIQLRCKASRFE